MPQGAAGPTPDTVTDRVVGVAQVAVGADVNVALQRVEKGVHLRGNLGERRANVSPCCERGAPESGGCQRFAPLRTGCSSLVLGFILK